MADRTRVYGAIDRERDFQDAKWGKGRIHALPTWLLIMEAELEEAKHAWLKVGGPEALMELLQVIAVGVAALEQHGVVHRPGGIAEGDGSDE